MATLGMNPLADPEIPPVPVSYYPNPLNRDAHGSVLGSGHAQQLRPTSLAPQGFL